MVGSALLPKLQEEFSVPVLTRNRDELDLRDAYAVRNFFEAESPEVVILTAAQVGGIRANIEYPVPHLQDNLLIQTNVLREAYEAGCDKLVFLGSSCMYPRKCPQPMKEEHLMTGKLEPTNEGYALAKLAGLKLCQAYRDQYGFDAITVIPPNLYGPRDNFNPEESHVLAALLRKFHEAKMIGREEVEVWGTGSARREFLFVQDLAEGLMVLLKSYSSGQPLNIGSGEDIRILDLAELIGDIVGFQGDIALDPSKPDGMPRKLLDSTRAEKYGWTPSTSLRAGIERTYGWYRKQIAPEANRNA